MKKYLVLSCFVIMGIMTTGCHPHYIEVDKPHYSSPKPAPHVDHKPFPAPKKQEIQKPAPKPQPVIKNDKPKPQIKQDKPRPQNPRQQGIMLNNKPNQRPQGTIRQDNSRHDTQHIKDKQKPAMQPKKDLKKNEPDKNIPRKQEPQKNDHKKNEHDKRERR